MKEKIVKIRFAICFSLLAHTSIAGISADQPADNQGLMIAGRHTLSSNVPPQKVPTDFMVDGPLLGNGDVGVVLAGTPDCLKFFIGKNDFWSVKLGSPIHVGRVEVRCPQLVGGTWHTEQDMAQAEVRGSFVKAVATLATRSIVDANRNLLVTELTNAGTAPLRLAVSIHKAQEHGGASSGAGDGDFLYAPYDEPDGKTPWRYGHLEGPILAPLPPRGAPRVAVATRILGATPDTGQVITLAPGTTATIGTIILSNFDAEDCASQTKTDADALTPASITDTTRLHRQWWAKYWSRSFIEIPDKTIERAWVAGNYGMASCSRPGKIAPGLWGNWITMDKPAWRGDYHLNYNFQAPYYGVYANNHADLALPFYQALNDSIPEGRAMARRWKLKGILFPVSIGPWGWRPWGTEMTLGQKSNAAYAALLYIWHYQYTQDTQWLTTTGYPYLRAVAEFWEDYLKLEGNRYVIHADAIHEGSGDNVNPILTLGMVHTLFKNMLTMSADLGVDRERRAKWQDIVNHLSEFPLQERNGKTVFRYTEKGTPWWNDNTLGIQHIYPAGAIGLDSDPKLLETAHNTLAAMDRWEDNNGSSSWYAACARVGYNPQTTLAHLNQCIQRRAMPNGLMSFGGGGIENWAAPLQITEFLLQSHEGVLRFFPAWPKDKDARFGNLRAYGAFLASAEQKNGLVTGVKIVSEKGRDCTVLNPRPNKRIRVIRNGKAAEAVEGDRFTLKTAVNEIIEIEFQPDNVPCIKGTALLEHPSPLHP